MANLVTYAKQVWQDAKTAITAARLNNMEKGISDCATQINKLGDSVSQRVMCITASSNAQFDIVECAKLIVAEMAKAGVEMASGYVFMSGQRAFIANRYTSGNNASVFIFDRWMNVHVIGELNGEWSYKKL